MPNAADFEKLGVFYLGRPYDWQQKKAQDGRYAATYGSFSFDMRVSTLPTVDGERFTIRILRKSSRSLDINEKALGPEHPSTANSLNNLAFLYFLQDRYAEAEPLSSRALEI